ncbi:MAG TPA: OmpA family protein [Bacteroidia bacterium]|jgi:outer membrane protein OmpA-like peptidoglycan-associated protein|nr:OmpA family protein [Bacteroidia bacterium]
MRRCLILLYSLFLILNSSFVFSQHHATCDSAAIVISPTYGPVYADGKPNPLLAMPHSGGLYFEKPHTVVWFTFVIPDDTVLTFDLVPANNAHDLDFLLFKNEIGHFNVNLQRLMPVRSNIARNDKGNGGRTGLSLTAENKSEPLGNHPAYSKALEVKRGEIYYLAVDNYTQADGPFTLFLHLRFPVAKLLAKPEKKPNLRPLSSLAMLKIFIEDSSGKPIKTRLKIMSLYGNILKDTSNVSAYSIGLVQKAMVKIVCVSPGYFLNQSAISLSDTATVLYDTVRLSKIEANKSMVLEDIEFEPDQDVFLSTAMQPLSDLLEFMQTNTDLNILIKGYVNDPTGANGDKNDQVLSENRAKAVLKYLTDHNIDKNRMTWKGFGNKDMLYPNARTWEEQKANRRVEIEIK